MNFKLTATKKTYYIVGGCSAALALAGAALYLPGYYFDFLFTVSAILAGAMFLLGYYEDGQPVMGLPGCVMYVKATIFDLILPRVAAGLSVTKQEIAALGCGGLCLGCAECHYPVCPFGKE